ncbi:response regulator transcription factor [Streptococcus lactarius]|uniref:DNA-binding response regulator n=1 Tax=Streptococcus lactarius TaxID=684066 RepID=A0A9X0WQH8_9STRE|nr:response regulator transcription factor [Streptococcus lactarius]MBK4780490.1 DNA-binding response regulator [Streptococcus lactarius]QUB38167.1 response regulator transcription factor [Streptococcus lactarius]
MKYKILAIDDDEKILRLIGNALEANNFHVETRKNIEEINICDFTGFDLILLDVMMPISGLEICRYIRSQITTPILFLTAKDFEEDILKGIQVGADDYITKPFSIKELIARIQMHLRREERSHPDSKEEMNSDITFYRNRQEVYYQSKRISLTKREFDLLYLLAKNKNRIFSIEELYNYLYPVDSDAQLRSITEYIYQIRQKFKIHQIDPIKTVWGGGYKWKKN